MSEILNTSAVIFNVGWRALESDAKKTQITQRVVLIYLFFLKYTHKKKIKNLSFFITPPRK